MIESTHVEMPIVRTGMHAQTSKQLIRMVVLARRIIRARAHVASPSQGSALRRARLVRNAKSSLTDAWPTPKLKNKHHSRPIKGNDSCLATRTAELPTNKPCQSCPVSKGLARRPVSNLALVRGMETHTGSTQSTVPTMARVTCSDRRIAQRPRYIIGSARTNSARHVPRMHQLAKRVPRYASGSSTPNLAVCLAPIFRPELARRLPLLTMPWA